METTTAFGPKHGSQIFLPCGTNLFPAMKSSSFPLMTFPRKPAKQVRLKAIPTPTSDDRTFTKLPPSEWTDQFHSVSVDVSEMDGLRREIEAIKPKVREMLMSSKLVDSTKKRILMVYLLVSLGLAYHFEDEIEESLRDGFDKIDEMMASEDDLYTVSTIFWVFRTYGYNMSSDVFTRFKEDNGKFKECLVEDVRGMLSLYEASHLGTTTDYIMDEALSFASNNLTSLAEDEMCPSHFSRHIKNALCLSQRWRMEIIVAVEYIWFYEQEDDHDEMLLKFAKLNFNLLQRHYLQELKILTKWYKDHDFASKLPPYYREVIVEMHFFSSGMLFTPQDSRGRIMQAKLFIADLLHDDTCDRYATFHEVKSLVNSFERWAADDDMDTHPEFLNFVFKFILDTFDECEREMRREGESYRAKEIKEEFKIYARSSLDLAKLAPAGHVPSFKEYMEVSKVAIGAYVTVAGALMAINQIDGKKAFDWLKSRPRILVSLANKIRFLNDLTGFEEDMRRGCVSTGINSYAKQHGITEDEAFRKFREMLADECKIMNEEFLMTSDVPRRVLKIAIDCARIGWTGYNLGEGVTHPKGKITKDIISLYVDRICF